MGLESPGAERRHGAECEEEVVVDDGVALGEVRGDVLELHGVGTRRRPLEADDVGHIGEALDQAEGEPRRGPEGVVDDDADVRRGGGARTDKFLEVRLAVLEVEGAGRGRRSG
jgi:hypothetical protein